MNSISLKKTGPGRTVIAGAPDGFTAVALAEMAFSAPGQQIIHVSRDDAGMARMSDALSFVAPVMDVMTFPAWDCLPYDRVSPNGEVVARRVDALTHMASSEVGDPFVLLTTVSAAVQLVPPRAAFQAATLSAQIGDRIDIDTLSIFLARNGYVRSATVRETGEFAVRGGIVDVFPPGAPSPIRLDFFGDELEGVRSFDAMSQRTEDARDGFTLRPVSEVLLDEDSVQRFRSAYRSDFGIASDEDPLYEAISAGRRYIGMEHWLPLFHEPLEPIFDYLPAATVIFDHDVEIVITERQEMIADYYDARHSMRLATGKTRASNEGASVYKPVSPQSMFMDATRWSSVLSDKAIRVFSPFAVPEQSDSVIDAGAHQTTDFTQIRQTNAVELFDAVRDRLESEKKRRILVTGHSAGTRDRIGALLNQHNIETAGTISDWSALIAQPPGSVSLAALDLEKGFITRDVLVITEQDILGERLSRSSRRRRRGEEFLTEVSSLSAGDYVVHIDHGVGQFDGLETVKVGVAQHDCLRVLYAGASKLYVPVENIEVLSRYGSEDSNIQLDRLGGQAWQARKARIKEHIREIAGELLAIAAERTLSKGEAIHTDKNAYEDFCARFPYSETDDQLGAIADVLSDLESGRPMDRLICGDVGFGKTEIALRAAFAAALDGQQVAVVVPTTLLARQHAQQFKDRFKGLPVRVSQLSRFVTAKDADKVREELAEGTVDIVVGTHALLSKSVRFARLGLIIVDEEQHFGVSQKERLKQLKANVHVLTLTATPIPRTLQMALSGVRELSIIATPPVDRLAVRTFVMPHDPVVLREAILRERHRGGQTFYVCPRVADIRKLRESLREIVPETRVAVAHGQMSPTELEDVMTAFAEGEYDILLCTHIIESGLDLPRVNTMILHRADMFGLSQLYQLRGRVGRSKTRAYCYFTIPPGRRLTPAATRRLEVMQTLDTLGAGFTLASHDLDIRGAGNLLGEEQSGHVREVGVELYQRMLEEAVVEAKGNGGTAANEWVPQIAVGTSVLIPENYVEDLTVRMGLYRRLSMMTEDGEIDSFAAELIDRFGSLPAEVENLLEIMTIKQLCRKAGVEKLDAGPKGMILSFRDNQFANPGGLIGYLQKHASRIKLRPDHKLVCVDNWQRAKDRIPGVRKVLQQLVAVSGD